MHIGGEYIDRRRVRRRKYYIGVQYTGGYDPDTGKRLIGAWPVLYKTRPAAEIAMSILPVFKNAKKFGIKSAAVYSVRVPPFVLS